MKKVVNTILIAGTLSLINASSLKDKCISLEKYNILKSKYEVLKKESDQRKKEERKTK